jgi:hypothetical protein
MTLEQLTSMVTSRLLLAGAPAAEAPYLAREAIAVAAALGFGDAADHARLAVLTLRAGPALAAAPEDRAVLFTVLADQASPPSARLEFLERRWLGPESEEP